MLRLVWGVLVWGLATGATASTDGFAPLPEPPAELRTGFPAPGGSAQPPVAEKTFSFGPPRLAPGVRGGVRVEVPGLGVYRLDAQPDVPVQQWEQPWQGGEPVLEWNAQGASVLTHPISPVTSAPALYWTDPGRGNEFAQGPPGRYYPGKLARVSQVGNRVRVEVFPIQWDRVTQTFIAFSQVHVRLLRAGLREGVQNNNYATPSAGGAWGGSQPESLILVRQSALPAARRLRDWHGQKYAMVSDIVTVEAIAALADPIDESLLPAGYKDGNAEAFVKPHNPQDGSGYDYELARRIAQYLQVQLHAGRLRYITLLGDALDIPPSYYFSTRSGVGVRFGVTDLCYAAVHECLVPKAAIGRLPLKGDDAVRRYLEKVDAWLQNAPGAPTELALYGGKAFGGPFYYGELGALRALRAGADWRGVTKSFRTKGNYAREDVLEMVRGESSSAFVYALDHGLGNLWRVERESITSAEIAAMPAPDNGFQPVVVSIACSNGAYDVQTSAESLFAVPGAGSDSIGVAMLRSSAGAVAYIGSSRPALGRPVFEVDEAGNLELLQTNQSLRLLDTALEHYRATGSGRLGDFTLSALAEYAADAASELTTDAHRWTYMNLSVLGDPVMTLPRRAHRTPWHPIARAIDTLEAGFIFWFPALSLGSGGSAGLRLSASVPAQATLVRQSMSFGVVSETVDWDQAIGPGESDVSVEDGEGRNTFFMRLENAEGVPAERQVWFQTR